MKGLFTKNEERSFKNVIFKKTIDSKNDNFFFLCRFQNETIFFQKVMTNNF